jgi:hypothetical protein
VHDLSPLFLLLLAAGVVIVVLAWRLALQRDATRANEAVATREESRRVAAAARTLRAAAGEQGASGLLGRAGYAVLGRQVHGSWTVHADGQAVTFGLRADYLVSLRGRRYIAEVKTGRLAPRLSHGPTRRQLLEYSAAFDVHGVILVDADAETITHVEIDYRRARPPQGRWLGPWPVAILGVLTFFAGLLLGNALGR